MNNDLLCVFLCTALSMSQLQLHPGLPGGDSGELMAACAQRSVPHPPGFPLQTVLCSYASALFSTFVDVPKNIHALSYIFCFFGAILVALSASLCCPLPGTMPRFATAILCVVLTTRSPSFVDHATQYEVFSLNFLFTGWLLFFWARIEVAPPGTIPLPRVIELVIWGSLAAGHQYAISFIAAPMLLRVFYLLWRRSPDRKRACQTILKICVSVALCTGFLYVLFSQFLDRTHVTSWGEEKTHTFYFLHYFRHDYGVLKLHSGRGNLTSASHQFAEKSKLFSRFTCQNVSPVLFLFTIGPPLPSMSMLVLLVVAFVSASAFSLMSNLDITGGPIINHVYYRFWFQSMPFLWIFASVRTVDVTWRVAGRLKVFIIPVLVAFLLTPQEPLRFVQNETHFPFSSLGSHHHVLDTFSRSVLSTIPNRSVLITSGDIMVTSLRFTQWVLLQRQDIIHVDYELVHYEWYRQRIQRVFGLIVPHPASARFVEDTLLLSSSRGRPLLVADGAVPQQLQWKKSVNLHYHGYFYLVSKRNNHKRECRQPYPEPLLQFDPPVSFVFSNVSIFFPWEAAVLQFVSVSRKNALLAQAVFIENGCAKSDFHSLKDKATQVLRRELFDPIVYNNSILPIVSAFQRV